MADNECKDTRFRHIAGMVADETAARLNGGQVDSLPVRRKPSIGNILTLLAMAGGLLVVGWNAASEATSIKVELAVVKARQTEDRIELNGRVKEIRDDMGQVLADMRKILGAVERINGRQDAERDRRGR